MPVTFVSDNTTGLPAHTLGLSGSIPPAMAGATQHTTIGTLAEELLPHWVVVFVTPQVKPTEPLAPAVYVTESVPAPAVIEPLLIVQV